jgi:hypothetical protein
MNVLIFTRENFYPQHSYPAEECRICFETVNGDIWADIKNGKLILSDGKRRKEVKFEEKR